MKLMVRVLGTIVMTASVIGMAWVVHMAFQPEPPSQTVRVFVPAGAEVRHRSQIKTNLQFEISVPLDELARYDKVSSAYAIVGYSQIASHYPPVYEYWLPLGDGTFYSSTFSPTDPGWSFIYERSWMRMGHETWVVRPQWLWIYFSFLLLVGVVVFLLGIYCWKLAGPWHEMTMKERLS